MKARFRLVSRHAPVPVSRHGPSSACADSVALTAVRLEPCFLTLSSNQMPPFRMVMRSSFTRESRPCNRSAGRIVQFIVPSGLRTRFNCGASNSISSTCSVPLKRPASEKRVVMASAARSGASLKPASFATIRLVAVRRGHGNSLTSTSPAITTSRPVNCWPYSSS